MRAFIARDLDGALYLYTSNPPIKGAEGWIPSSKLDTLSSLNWKLFPDVKWDDKEPTEINIDQVHFYVVRDNDNLLWLYLGKPYRYVNGFNSCDNGCVIAIEDFFSRFELNPKDFENLKFEDEPVEVFLNLEN